MDYEWKMNVNPLDYTAADTAEVLELGTNIWYYNYGSYDGYVSVVGDGVSTLATLDKLYPRNDEIDANTSGLADAVTDIATNASGLADAVTDIATNTSGLADAVADIATNTTKLVPTVIGGDDFLHLGVYDGTTLNVKPTITQSGTWASETVYNQGLANDGTYMYYAPDHDTVTKYALTDGTTAISSLTATDKIGGLYYYETNGYLYTVGGTYVEDGDVYISVIDPDTMTVLNTYDISSSCNWGANAIVVIDSIIYIGETAANYDGLKSWHSFDLTGNYIETLYSAQTDSGENDWQDATYYGGYILATDHTGILNVFEIGDSVLTKVGFYDGGYTEGITFVGDVFYLYDAPYIYTASLSISGCGAMGISSDGELYLNNMQYGLGYGQVWNNVTDDRLTDTTYTNTRDKPIAVKIRGALSTSYTIHTVAKDGGSSGILIDQTINDTTARSTSSFIVPSGFGYYVELTSGSISTWVELY